MKRNGNNGVCCFILCLVLSLSEANVGKQTSNVPVPVKPAGNVCSISYQTDFADKEPVLLRSSRFGYEILEPVTSVLNLKTKDEIFIACPGVNNKITGFNVDFSSARCVHDKTVTVNNVQKDIKQLSCDKRVTGQFLETTEPCGKRGVTKYTGHKFGDKWHTILNVCYDQKRGESLYAKHTLHGSAIEFSKDGKSDAGFKIGGLEYQVKHKEIFTTANLKKIFTTLLQASNKADQYINAKSTLINAQLSPKDDFVFSPSQYSTYYFVNTVPQWKEINNNNWKTLENSIRKTASNLKETFKIITGTYDVLTLKNKNGQDTKIYLDVMNTLPVPKYIWKIVYSIKTKKAIAFVTLNDPFIAKVSNSEHLCTDVCDKHGWTNPAFKDLSKGLTYCCDVKQLMEKVKTIPQFGDVTGIQEGKLQTSDSKPLVTAAKPAAGCTLKLATDFLGKDPLLMKKITTGYELITPVNDIVSLLPNQEVFIACSNPSNSISKINKKSVTATCVSGKQIKIEGKTYNFADLNCIQRVIGDLKPIPRECGDRGIMKRVGFKIDANNFVQLINVCYDHKEGIPIYSEHILEGSSIEYRRKELQPQDYKISGLEFRVSAEEDYKKENQLITFEKLLGSKDLANKYIKPNAFLARAHLSPVGDFVYGTSKYTTYYYINVVPQWQTINNGNWKTLENAIRTTASSLKANFEITTGGFGTLTLKNSAKKDVEIYLDISKTLPVPKYVWKIMYSAETKKGIAFVSLNNPFVETAAEATPICPNICKKYGWGTPEWDKKDKGVVYCCEVKEFLKVVDTVPQLGIVGEVQEFKFVINSQEIQYI